MAESEFDRSLKKFPAAAALAGGSDRSVRPLSRVGLRAGVAHDGEPRARSGLGTAITPTSTCSTHSGHDRAHMTIIVASASLTRSSETATSASTIRSAALGEPRRGPCPLRPLSGEAELLKHERLVPLLPSFSHLAVGHTIQYETVEHDLHAGRRRCS